MRINPIDNVDVNVSDGHKYANRSIKAGEAIIKYGNRIGYASSDIAKGEHVHSHNMKTALSGEIEYSYAGPTCKMAPKKAPLTFMGYEREDGSVGVRNEVWIVPTVGCVNEIAKTLATKTGALAWTHPFGCSQLGDDQKTTQLILKGMVNHPNAGGVLVLGLGCENNNIEVFKKVLGPVNEKRVKFLNTQDCTDEIIEGINIIKQLQSYADTFKRKELPVSKLIIGLKCGGSDGMSGITANPLVGRVSDELISMGGSTVLTEVPEMFGAEHLLMERAESREIFDKTVSLINNFKDYYKRHNQVIYENPSPGNKAGGITTLEEKSLGCVQKGGTSPVVDVLDYGDHVTKNGLSLLNGPGNDIVACTNLMAAGAHIILFTTGRGTPLGGAVPTIKISTNTRLYEHKPSWIDFNAGPISEAESIEETGLVGDLMNYIVRVASGMMTKNEANGFHEISIFKDGVVL